MFLLYFYLLSPTWQSFGTSGREQIYVSAPAPISSKYSIYGEKCMKILYGMIIKELVICEIRSDEAAERGDLDSWMTTFETLKLLSTMKALL